MTFFDPGRTERALLFKMVESGVKNSHLVMELAKELEQRIAGLESRRLPEGDTSGLRESIEGLGEAQFDVLEGVKKQDEYNDRRFEHLTLGLAEGIERVKRSERRINATVARARKELANHGYESPGLEAEASELHELDAEGSDGGGVLPLRGEVVEHLEAPRGIPGTFSQEVLQALRGKHA